MIRVNLAKKRKVSEGGGGGEGSRSLGALFESGSNTLGPILLILGVPLLIGLGAYYFFDSYIEEKTRDMEAELANFAKEKAKIEADLMQVKGFETKKDQLEKNSGVIRIKIETIEKLIRDRDTTAKSLIYLAEALPKELWLTQFHQGPTGFEIHGAAVDAGLITDFMTKLQKSIYFKEVQLGGSSASDAQGSRAEFILTGKGE